MKEARKWSGTWPGGRHYEVDGRRIWVIEKMRSSNRYTIRLNVKTEKDAMVQLQTFFTDPANYKEVVEDLEGVPLTEERIAEYIAVLQKRKVSDAYRKGMRGYLIQWCNKLEGVGLRRVKVEEAEKMLDAWKTARNYRIEALKGICSYLSYLEKLPSENIGAKLKKDVTQRRAAKLEEPGYKIEEVEAAYREHLSQAIRDVMVLGFSTGMHVSEVDRLARGQGEIIMAPRNKVGIAAVIRFVHKDRSEHRNTIGPRALAAAQRLMKRGSIPRQSTRNRAEHRAAVRLSKKLGREVRPVHLGDMRHSYITWCREFGRTVKLSRGGLDLVEIAALVNHKDTKMIRERYDKGEFPPMGIVPRLKLYHPDDPT